VVDHSANLHALPWFPGGIFIPSAVVSGVALLLALCLAAPPLRAGCDFSEHDGGLLSSHDRMPGSSPLSFLGQWVYVAGEIRCDPWHGVPPCQGPGCRSKDKAPATSSSSSSNQRSSPVATVSSRAQPASNRDLSGHIALSPLSTRAGFPREHEYPP
jgi:hypothetical protein